MTTTFTIPGMTNYIVQVIDLHIILIDIDQSLSVDESRTITSDCRDKTTALLGSKGNPSYVELAARNERQ
jgi:hypothetical protein